MVELISITLYLCAMKIISGKLCFKEAKVASISQSQQKYSYFTDGNPDLF